MRFIRFLKSARDAVRDPNRDFDERLYLVLSLASEIIVFIAFIGDIIFRENPNEIILIGATLIFVPFMALLCLYLDKLKAAIKITAIGVVFIILPGLFFFGGGVKGGGVIWFIFAYMYIGLLLHGKWRNVMFVLLAVNALAFYYVGYHYPW